jgi:plasmid stability protein
MASVTVRNLEPGTVNELKVLAARNGRSMQVELRRMILRHLDSPSAQAEDASKVPLALPEVPEWYSQLFEIRATAFGLRDAKLPRWTSPMRQLGRPGMPEPQPEARHDAA